MSPLDRACQVGDILDRGEEERECLELLLDLKVRRCLRPAAGRPGPCRAGGKADPAAAAPGRQPLYCIILYNII